jgi:hypothetical protein
VRRIMKRRLTKVKKPTEEEEEGGGMMGSC